MKTTKETQQQNNTIKTANAKIELLSVGLVKATSDKGAHEALENAIENTAAIKSLSSDKRALLLVDLREVAYQEKEARDYYVGEENAKVVISVALLIGNPVSRIIGNFFMGINKPPFPVQLFTDEAKAIDWLKTFKTSSE